VPLSTSSETHRTQIIALAERHRLPAVYPSRLFVTSGGLTAYGPDTIINLKTAKALGLDVPDSLLARADEVTPVQWLPGSATAVESRSGSWIAAAQDAH
jgi:hypothetical protein